MSAQGFTYGHLGAFVPFADGLELCAKVQWQGERCELVLVIDKAGVTDELAATACALIAQADDWDAAMRRAALALYGLWDREWRGPEHSALSEAAWIAELRLDRISIYPEGKSELILDPADLFAGHVILISGSLSGGLNEADIAG